MASKDTSGLTITENAKMPVKLVATIVGPVLASVLWLQTTLFAMRRDIELLQASVKDLSAQIASVSSDGWSHTDMDMWVELLRVKNPALVIPEPMRHR